MSDTIKIINVLSADTYQDCHIKDSISVPLNDLAEFAKELPKDTEVIVHCAHFDCPLSKRAWRLLTDLGFTNVRAYEGGMAEWCQKGYPTVGPCNESYLKEEHFKPLEGDEQVKTITVEELKQKLNI